MIIQCSNLDGGTLNLDGGTLTLYNLSTAPTSSTNLSTAPTLNTPLDMHVLMVTKNISHSLKPFNKRFQKVWFVNTVPFYKEFCL